MTRVYRPVLALFALLLLGVGCSATEPEPEPEGAIRVLFVGNSLTYTNDLPGVVEAFGEAGGLPVVTRSLAYPNYALEDHWARGEARDMLASGDWDVVVMQQGPSSLPENQEHLRVWAGRFADEARRYGITPALYQVWPSASRDFAFPAVLASYANAAEASDALLFPVGAAWQEAWARRSSLGLYGPDGFHPSPAGTYLAALVIYGGLTGAPLSSLPHELRTEGGTRIEVSISEARLMQRAAASILADHAP